MCGNCGILGIVLASPAWGKSRNRRRRRPHKDLRSIAEAPKAEFSWTDKEEYEDVPDEHALTNDRLPVELARNPLPVFAPLRLVTSPSRLRETSWMSMASACAPCAAGCRAL